MDTLLPYYIQRLGAVDGTRLFNALVDLYYNDDYEEYNKICREWKYHPFGKP